MQVFIDAWLERREPVLFIRACENGQALFSLKGDEINRLLNRQDLCCDDLRDDRAPRFTLKELVIN